MESNCTLDTASPSTSDVLSFVVKMVLTLPLSLTVFTDDRQKVFKAALATAAGIVSKDVSLDEIRKVITRQLLSERIRVEVSIKAVDKATADTIVRGLTAKNINKEFAEVGFPAVSINDVSITADCKESEQEHLSGTPSSEALPAEMSSNGTSSKELFSSGKPGSSASGKSSIWSVPLIIGFAVGFVVLSGTAFFCLMLRRRKRLQRVRRSQSDRLDRYLDQMNLSATDKAPSEVQRHSSAPLPMPRAWSANFAKSGQSEAAQMDSGQVQETVQITIPHIAMSELKVDAQSLASGSFKTVYRAYWSNAKRIVALLELRNTRNAPMSAMQEEARIFITLGKHRHLAQLLATSTNPASGDVCMLMEFAPQGNLTHVLNKAEEDQVDVSNQVLITTALQVADAMVHLDLHKVIHRDLAARNVLVFDFDYSNFKKVLVKVTDYGLAMLTHKGFSCL